MWVLYVVIIGLGGSVSQHSAEFDTKTACIGAVKSFIDPLSESPRLEIRATCLSKGNN